MHHVYLYGASDDCMEMESTFGDHESYVGLKLGPVTVHYDFDGDWGIWLEGEIPADWTVKSIEANCGASVRGYPHAGQFIHIQMPSPVEVINCDEEED